MAILIGTALLLSLVYFSISAARERVRRTPEPLGLEPIQERDLAREAELSRQLVSGRMAPVAYQQAMTALAQSRSGRTGDQP